MRRDGIPGQSPEIDTCLACEVHEIVGVEVGSEIFVREPIKTLMHHHSGLQRALDRKADEFQAPAGSLAASNTRASACVRVAMRHQPSVVWGCMP